MCSKQIYDHKLVILDIDFREIDRYNLDEYLNTKKMMSKISADQHLILVTDNHISEAVESVEKMGIKSGYLVGNSGASVINIANKKIMVEETISSDIALKIAYQCIWNNLNFSINTQQNGTFPFRAHSWIIEKHKHVPSRLYEYKDKNIESITDLKKCINENNIYNMEIYFLEKNNEIKKKQMQSLVDLISKFEAINHSINGSYIHILSSKISKLKAVEHIAKSISIELNKNSIYCAIHQCSTEICENAYFINIWKDVIIKNDHPKLNPKIPFEMLHESDQSWTVWFENNLHLWTGDDDKNLKKLLSKGKRALITLNDVQGIKNLKIKYISINLNSQEVTKMHTEQERRASLFGNPTPGKNILLNIGFWPKQVNTVIEFIESNNIWVKKQTYN